MANTTELPKSPLLDATGAHELIASFFPKEWAATPVAAVQVKQLTGGLMNTLYLVQRDTAATCEPNAVLVRHFGLDGKFEEPAGSSLVLSAAQQAIVFWEMGRRGWGPKIYGTFAGGRVEEFIDSHTLTSAESEDPMIRRDVARSYARFHSLELPLRKDSFEVVIRDLSRSVQEKREQTLSVLSEVDDPVARAYTSVFQKTDWARELNWVSRLFKKHNCMMTVTHVDSNYLNILVKKSKSDCRAVLIDYETTTYSYRGLDIGGHFNERVYCYNQPDTQLTGFAAPDLAEQRLFCEAYIQEMKDLGQNLSEHDTVSHLVLEANIGRMYQILLTNLMCTVFDEVEVDPLFLSGTLHMMQTYNKLKLEFIEAYEQDS